MDDPQAVNLRPDWRERVMRDQCPVLGCGTDDRHQTLDTGWQCWRCNFDAFLIAQTEGLTRQ